MIKSMTGFAALTREDDRVALNVTLRAVNHRFLDVQTRMPPSLGDQEARIRALVQQVIARGRVEVSVGMQPKRAVVPHVELNEPFVAALEHALERARLRGVVAGPLTPGDLVRLVPNKSGGDPEVGRRAAEEDDGVLDVVERELLTPAGLRPFSHERALNASTWAGPDARRSTLAALIERIASAAADGQAGVQSRLSARVAELSADLPVDRTAIAQEIVRVVGRSDISEEVTRFRAHLQHWVALVEGAEPCGRKLDFLLQESEPRDQHHRLEGRRRHGVRAGGDGEGRAREDARAGAECRVRRAPALHHLGALGHRQNDAGRASRAGGRSRASRSFTSRPPAPASWMASTIISSAASASSR
jgi:uncharacterized protein (TIGR00255 family)